MGGVEEERGGGKVKGGEEERQRQLRAEKVVLALEQKLYFKN